MVLVQLLSMSKACVLEFWLLKCDLGASLSFGLSSVTSVLNVDNRLVPWHEATSCLC
jgi:hypothetical protein